MTQTNFSLAADLSLRTSPFVTAANDAERATKGLRDEASQLDRVLNTQLSPHLDSVATSLGKTRKELDAGRVSLFGYEDALIRTARATSDLARESRSRALAADFAKDVGRGAIGIGVNEAFGGGLAGGLLGNAAAGALSKVPAIAGWTAAIAGTGIVVDAALDKIVGFTAAMEENARAMTEAAEAARAYNSARIDSTFDRSDSIFGAQSAAIGLGIAEGDASRASIAEAEARRVLKAKQTETAGLQAELSKQLAAQQAHAAALAALPIGRAAAARLSGSLQFESALSAAPGAREDLTFQRVSALATEARILQGSGQGDAARSRFTEAQQLLQGLFSALGSPLERLQEFQSAIASLGAEIDASFIASLDAEAVAHDNAAKSVASLTPQVNDAASQIQLLTANVSALAAATKAANDELNRAQSANVSAQSAANLASVTIPGVAPGFAQGGRNRDPRDNILALLREGETVLTPEHSKKLAPWLAAAGVPGYADGGFASILQGTRNFSMVAQSASFVDEQVLNLGFRKQAEDLMRLGMPYQQAQDVIARRRAAGLPPVFPGYQQTPTLTSSLGGVPGFANGGRAGGSQSLNVQNLNVNYRAQGGTQRDAYAIAREIKTQLSRGQISLD